VEAFLRIKPNEDPESLRVKLLQGKTEEAYALLVKEEKDNEGACYWSIPGDQDSQWFHLGHYLVACNSMLLFERFKASGAWSWSSPMLPIHLAIAMPGRDHWIPILKPLSGEKVDRFGIEGYSLTEWAIANGCSLTPLIQQNAFSPTNRSHQALLFLAELHGNTKASNVLHALIDY